MNRLLWMGCLSYLLVGLAHVIIGSLLPELILHYRIDYSMGGQLVFAQFSGFLIGVLLVPWMSAKFSKRTTLQFMLVGLGASQIIYGSLPSWPWMYATGFIAGFGFGAIEAIIGSLIIESIREIKAVAKSRLEVCFGIGAFIMPLIVSWMIEMGWWRFSFYIIGLFAMVLACGYRWLPFGRADEHLSIKTVRALEKRPHRYSKREIYILLFFILFFLVYVGIEMSLVNFMPSFMILIFKMDTAAASLSVTFFWVAMVVGRIVTGMIAEKISYAAFLLGSCFASFIFTAMFAFISGIWSVFAIIMLMGLLMSGIFAIGLLLANQLLSGKTQMTTSILIASGGVGGALLPLAIGWMMDSFNANTAIYFVIGCTFLLFALSIIAHRMNASLRQSTELNVFQNHV